MDLVDGAVTVVQEEVLAVLVALAEDNLINKHRCDAGTV